MGEKDKFHVGYCCSVCDEAQAKALETPAKHAFRRIHECIFGYEPCLAQLDSAR